MWTGMLYKCHPHPIKTLAALSLPVLQWDGPSDTSPWKGQSPLHGMAGSLQHCKARSAVKRGWLALVHE